ncbi:MAG: SDR family NAD(P)-dependent oxidoreductase, partial [Luteimonas sp.]|nr:SDR family NAD(P)-dependent oxidoreductase [Luteimonas sp.]
MDTTVDKTSLITGATSGFGAAAVERFLREGWRVVATGRRADRLQR